MVLCPTWAELIARDLGDVAAVQEHLFTAAVVTRDEFPRAHQEWLDERGLFDDRGRVRLLAAPEDVTIVVAGGLGSLHAMALPGFGRYGRVTTRPLLTVPVPA